MENINLYKLFIKLVKVIPMIIALADFINSFLSYYGIHIKILNYLFGISGITILFLYIVSYILKFCVYHRMFIHYILMINIINIIDCYIHIPINDFQMFMIYNFITCITLFTILYFKRIKI